MTVHRTVTAAALSALLVCAPAAGFGTQLPAAHAGDLAQVVGADERVAPAGEQAVITEGHIDIGAHLDGTQADLLARDDSQPQPVWRRGEDVVYVLGDTALQTLPAGNDYSFVGAQEGAQVWVVPQTEVAGVPWIGWNTQAPSLVAAADRGVRMSFLGHSGPGEFSLFLQNGGFEPPQLLWSTVAAGEDSLWVDLHTHTHANWTFTEPGVHQVGLRVTVPLANGSEVTADHILTFAVGSSATTPPDIAAAQAAQWDPAAAATGSGQGLPGWLIWVGGGAAAVVLVVLLGMFARRKGAGDEL